MLRRFLLGVAIAAGLLMAVATAAAGAATLDGEAFSASMSADSANGNPFPFILGQCGNWYYSSPTFDIHGQASGPYPGSFEEQGSVTYSSTAPSNNPWGQGPVLTFNTTFTITEPDGATVSAAGTATLVPSGDLAVCWGSAGGGGVNIGPFLTHYTATITNPNGTISQDSGSSYVTLSQSVGLGEFWYASLIQSFFDAAPPPPPTLTLSDLTATVSGSTVNVSVHTSPAIINATLEEGGAKVAPDCSPVNGVASWTLTDLAPGAHTLAVQGWDSPSGHPGDHSGVQTFIVTVPSTSPSPSPTPPPITTLAPPQSAPTPPPVARSARPHIRLLLPDKLSTPALLRRSGYVWSITVPERGRLSVTWRHHQTMIARGQTLFRTPGRVRVMIHLTASGRRLLQVHRSLRVATEATYTAAGGIRVSRRQPLRLVK